MSNFDYETGVRKPDLSAGSNGLGILLLVAIVVALLALFSFFGGGTTPNATGDATSDGGAETVAPVVDAPTAPAPAAAD